MKWIEIIQIRSYTLEDSEAAVAAFSQLSSPGFQIPDSAIRLFRNSILKTDLSIFIQWEKGIPNSGKSSLGMQLAKTFSDFGMIHHTSWMPQAELYGYRMSANQ